MMRAGEDRAPYLTPLREIPSAFGGNRAARRKGQPVTVSREIPVTVMQHADGSHTVVNHEADDPCYDCRCCALWARSLDALAAAIRAHEAEAHAQLEGGLHDRNCRAVLFDAACTCVDRDPSCLVCAMLDGQADG